MINGVNFKQVFIYSIERYEMMADISRIPFDKFSEDKGTLQITINAGNLYEHSDNIIFFDELIGKTYFKLYRDSEFDLIFKQKNTQNEVREAKINLNQFGRLAKLFIVITWSVEKNGLSVGEPNKSNLVHSYGQWEKLEEN